MDKKRLCYVMRSHYPEIFGIRKFLQRVKVKRLYRYFLSEKEIRICELDSSKKEEIIAPYLLRWEKHLRPVVAEMEDILENARAYQIGFDKDELRTDMLFCRLAYGFIPSEYVSFAFENKTPAERKEFESDIDTNVFGYSVNNIKFLQSIIDKGDSYKQFATYFKRDALIVERLGDYDKFQAFIQKHPVFVEKKVFSSMGRGVNLIDIRGIETSEKEYFKRLIKDGKYLLEEKVVQHKEMAKFNASSINTIRCMTFRTSQGIEIPYCFMRTGRNGTFVDNGGSGGLVIGVNTLNGVVNTDGYDEYNGRFAMHPDTGILFQGSQIPAWEELINLCKEAAEKVEDMAYLSWDLAYTDQGWVVIEVNEVGQFIGPQMTMKRGIKTELMEYFNRMPKVI